tara:strand:- start:1982 stop:2830 length:849 start_codon:yes stop_codon:yes gene_type:complete
MANGNIDLFDTILQQRIDKSAEQIGQAGSDAQSNQSFGGMLGGLLGQYGVPALLSLIPGVGPGLAAMASIAGAGIGSYAGSEIGRKSTDMPETEYLQSKGRDVMNMLKENSLTAGITSAATAGASAVSMGADKYAAHLKNPLGLKSMVDKVKEDPSLGVTLTPTAVTPGYTPPSILNTPGRLSPAPMNLVTPPAVNVGGTLAPLGNVAGGGQLGAQIAKNPSLLNYVPNLGSSGLNLQTTGVWEGHNPLSNNPLLHQPLLTLPSGIQSPAGNIHKPYMPPII